MREVWDRWSKTIAMHDRKTIDDARDLVDAGKMSAVEALRLIRYSLPRGAKTEELGKLVDLQNAAYEAGRGHIGKSDIKVPEKFTRPKVRTDIKPIKKSIGTLLDTGEYASIKPRKSGGAAINFKRLYKDDWDKLDPNVQAKLIRNSETGVIQPQNVTADNIDQMILSREEQAALKPKVKPVYNLLPSSDYIAISRFAGEPLIKFRRLSKKVWNNLDHTVQDNLIRNVEDGIIVADDVTPANVIMKARSKEQILAARKKAADTAAKKKADIAAVAKAKADAEKQAKIDAAAASLKRSGFQL